MKQHIHSVNRDLEDELADVIEHQYARKLTKPAKDAESSGDATTGRTQRPREENSDSDDFETDMQELREKSGF